MADPQDWREARRLRAWELNAGRVAPRPDRGGTGCDAAAVAAWDAARWPARRNQADATGQRGVWVDAAGGSLLPGGGRTCAPRGPTPVRRAPRRRDHRSAIRAITPDERRCPRVQAGAGRGPAAVRFRRHPQPQLPGKVPVSGDGAPLHRGQAGQDCVATGAAPGPRPHPRRRGSEG